MTVPIKKVLACVDGSAYLDSVSACTLGCNATTSASAYFARTNPFLAMDIASELPQHDGSSGAW